MANILTKAFRADFKAEGADEAPEITMYAATFESTPDRMGDVIAPTAFDAWLEDFYAQGRPLPISYAHAALRSGFEDPLSILGWADPTPDGVWVDEHGLGVRARLDPQNERARAVHRLAKAGVIRDASFAFEVRRDHRRADRATVLDELWVHEAGPALQAVNPQAGVVAVKAVRDLHDELFPDCPGKAAAAVDTSTTTAANASTTTTVDTSTPATVDTSTSADEPSSSVEAEKDRASDDDLALKIRAKLAMISAELGLD